MLGPVVLVSWVRYSVGWNGSEEWFEQGVVHKQRMLYKLIHEGYMIDYGRELCLFIIII